MMQKNLAKVMLIKLMAALMLFAVTFAYAADNGVCSSASLINPNVDDGAGGTGAVANGGAGGTGAVADGGAGGTGITKESGMGGTGITADGGMGGTGISAEHGGFGGTGDAVIAHLLPQNTQGSIAIVGVVTGFASICVNGEEVFYDKNTPVYDNGMAAKLSSLTTGQMVMLKADKVGGQLRARAIGLFDAVSGPVEQLDSKHLQMQVMGQTVQLDQMTMQQMRALDAGTTVRVSGHRLASGEIVATKVSANNKNTSGKTNAASTLGIVTSLTQDGFAVNGTPVNSAQINSNDRNMLSKLKVGSEVRVGGDWNGSAIKAKHIEAQPIKNILNRANTAIMEGFARLDDNNGVSLSGTEVVLNKGGASYKNISSVDGNVVKMEMHRDGNGNWVCDKVEVRTGGLFTQHGRGKNKNSGGSRDENTGGGSDDSDSSGASSSFGSGNDSSSGSDDASGSGHGSSSSNSGSDSSSHNSGSSGSGSSSRSAVSSGGGASVGGSRSSGGSTSSGGGNHTSGGSGKNK